MGKNLSIIIGAIAALVGLILILDLWRYEFLFILKGTVPVLLIFGGVIALTAGISEFKDTLKSKK